jgi:hypothetical protein
MWADARTSIGLRTELTSGSRVAHISCMKWALGLVTLIPLSANAQQVEWANLPRMQLERQFAGPLQDTVIQRWRDPVDGTVCYVYLPITAPHSPPGQGGYVQYGPNTIGSVSCMSVPRPTAAAPRAEAKPKGDTMQAR